MKIFILLLGFFFSFNLSTCSAAYYIFKMIEPEENYSMKYDNENMFISFAIAGKNPDRLFVSIYNKTDNPITVKWSDSSLIFLNNAHSVLPASQIATGINAYSGIKDIKIPPHTFIEESLFAEGNIQYIRDTSPVIIHGGLSRYRGWRGYWGGWFGFNDVFLKRTGTWKTTPFFPSKKSDVEKTDLIGEKIGIYLVWEINDQEYNQRFDFAITKVSAKESPGTLGLMASDRHELMVLQKEHIIQSGVLIMALAEKGAAKKAGLLVGDNIIQIDSTTINNIEDFVKLLNDKKAKDTITITYIREGKSYQTAVQLKKV